MKPNLLAKLQTALEHHHAGRADEAEQLYRAVLRADAQNADALNLLGVLEYERGRNLEALDWLSKAVAGSSRTAMYHNNLGLVLMALRRHRDAAARFEQAGQLDQRLPDAFYNLGVARQELGQVDEAIAAYEKALTLAEDPVTLNNLGAAYLKCGRGEQAIRCFERAIQLQPDHADAMFNLAGALLECGRNPDAETRYRQVLALYRQELLRQPTSTVCVNLAHVLSRRFEFTFQFPEAEQLLRRALELQPDNYAAFNGLGNLFMATGRAEEAVLAYGQAIKLKGDDPHAYRNRGYARLILGDFPGGWDDCEYRWLCKGFAHQRAPSFAQPSWVGDDLNGRTLLVYAEQGRGDVIQFVRYLRLLADRGARVLLTAPAELQSLLGDLAGACQVVAPNQPLPPFDVHAALLSLPRLCGTRLENIPASVPYLPLPPVERFPLPPATPGRLQVGLIWAGGAGHPNDKFRSLSLEDLLPVLQTADCDFFSLQVGPRAADLAALPAGIRVTDIGSHVRDFADTAAVMRQLDLIISVDTSTLHLAGALARPAWALLPYAPDWRWLLQREDTPWYPTMRLFRQVALGDWAGVLKRVQDELSRVAGRYCESGGPPPLNWFQPSPSLPVTPAVGGPPDHEAGELNQLFMSGQTRGGFGWAVVNRGLFEALSKISKPKLITPADREFMSPKLPGFLLTTLGGHEFVPECRARARVNFGNAVFEQELTGRSVENAKRFDVVFVASNWCVERMREKGIPNGALLLQGIDTRVFRPAESKRQEERFVLFSGGKFELRKGQDLVLRAFRILARKFPDMTLMTSWHNLWPYSLRSMAGSPDIRFELKGAAWADQLAHLCTLNDIDPQRVVALPPGNPEQMAATYRLADLGLFPNRCEGATNLVLMEFLACGRPAIVSFNSGHCDVVSDQTAILLKNQRDFEVQDAGKRTTARWKEVSVDDIIAAVEYAYHHRAEMQLLGARAAEELARWDWARAAQEVLATMKRFAV